MEKSSQLHRFQRSIYIFSTILVVICLLLVALPTLAQDSSSSSSSQTTTQTTPPSSTGGIKANPGADKGSTPVPEAKPDFWHQQYLLGDWGGERTKLAEQYGVTFDFFYVTDMLYAENARIQDGGAGWNRVRGTMDIDFGKLAGVKNLFFHVTGLWQGGPNLGANYLGSISNPSGPVSARTEILDSYWLEYDMLDQKVAFRFGQFASMDIYGLQPYGGAFLMEPLDYGFNNRFNDYASFDPASGTRCADSGEADAVDVFQRRLRFQGNRNPYVQDPNGFHFVKTNSGVLSDEIGFVHDQVPNPKNADKKRYPRTVRLWIDVQRRKVRQLLLQSDIASCVLPAGHFRVLHQPAVLLALHRQLRDVRDGKPGNLPPEAKLEPRHGCSLWYRMVAECNPTTS